MSDPRIAQLQHEYADAVVYQDAARWAATWCTEATWSLPGGRDVEGKTAIVELWRDSLGKYAQVVQTILNGGVELDEAAGRGSGRWYIQEHTLKHGGVVGIMLAHYDDTYRVEDGAWRFASRRLTQLYRGPSDLTGTWSSPT